MSAEDVGASVQQVCTCVLSLFSGCCTSLSMLSVHATSDSAAETC